MLHAWRLGCAVVLAPTLTAASFPVHGLVRCRQVHALDNQRYVRVRGHWDLTRRLLKLSGTRRSAP